MYIVHAFFILILDLKYENKNCYAKQENKSENVFYRIKKEYVLILFFSYFMILFNEYLLSFECFQGKVEGKNYTT